MTPSALQRLQARDPEAIPSPALLVSLEAVNENLDHMIQMAGDISRLRPHVKTHKMPEVMRLQRERGINKFKCATIAEAEMCAQSGAPDVLLAYASVGPNVARFLQLVSTYPKTRFTACVDDPHPAHELSGLAAEQNRVIPCMVDLNCGMDRTGIACGDQALSLYQLLDSLPGLEPVGLHAYDGHITETDPKKREQACHEAFEPVEQLAERIRTSGLPEPLIVAGGTPTFPIHARNGTRECSPGTTVFWDAGYAQRYPDLPFQPAAAVLTRVISRPAPGRICLDLGHKAIASENPHPRVVFPDLPQARAVSHSEEHLVLETPDARHIPVGTTLLGIPWHICPTVALYHEAVVLFDRNVHARWTVTARQRCLTI